MKSQSDLDIIVEAIGETEAGKKVADMVSHLRAIRRKRIEDVGAHPMNAAVVIRIPLGLKDTLKSEANKRGITLSKHILSILVERNS